MNIQTKKKRSLHFTGEGGRFFGIWAVNVILSIITLGLYYPWAKIAIRKYLWNETSLKDNRFVFHGTGMEIFKGFVIIYAVLLLLVGTFFVFPAGVIILYLLLIFLMPVAIFGAWRYRVSKTSWRGIFFSFDGKLSEFLKIFFVGAFFTLITLGIYSYWLRIKLMKYLFSHTRFGQYRFSFLGEGNDWFFLNFAGGVLSVITLYIYLPWYIKDRFKYTINNISINHEGQQTRLRTNLEGSELFGVLIVNILIVFLTLGIGLPWAMMRYYKVLLNSVQIPENINFDKLEQRKDEYKNAMGEDLLDFFDIGIDF